MTRQEMFTTAYLGVIAQGGPSTSPDFQGCAYRGANGRKCGVGQIMTDEEYNPGMEIKNVATLVEEESQLSFTVPTWLVEEKEFLQDLQLAHDNASEDADGEEFIAYFRNNMRNLASDYDLTVPA